MQEGNSKQVRAIVRAAFKETGVEAGCYSYSDRSRGKDPSRLNIAIPIWNGLDAPAKVLEAAQRGMQAAGYSNTLKITGQGGNHTYIRFQAPEAV
jgi:hypothetical protein